MKPKIFVLARLEAGAFPFWGVHQDLVEAIRRSGGNPVLFCPGERLLLDEKRRLIAMLAMCSGIVLPGGDDYTEYDMEIIAYALKHNVPLLGICLGMQVMGAFGNAKTMHVLPDTKRHYYPEEDYVHFVHLVEHSHLVQYLNGKTNLLVNSRHHEEITSAKHFELIGFSPDGVIEALENPTHPFQIGVQWHPESSYLEDQASYLLFTHFVQAAKEHAAKK